MPANSTISVVKRAANQANAQHSTGPRTAEGIAKSKMNVSFRQSCVVLGGLRSIPIAQVFCEWLSSWAGRVYTATARSL